MKQFKAINQELNAYKKQTTSIMNDFRSFHLSQGENITVLKSAIERVGARRQYELDSQTLIADDSVSEIL